MNVLMLGRNAMMMQMGAKPMQDAGHTVSLYTDDHTAMTALQTGEFKALVIGMAVEHASRKLLRDHIANNKLAVKVLEANGPADLANLLAQLA